MNFRQNGVVIPTQRHWSQRLAPTLTGALLVGPFILLGVLVHALLTSEPEAGVAMSHAEGAAFEAGQALAREEMSHWVADAYEQGRRDALIELSRTRRSDAEALDGTQ